MDVHFPIEFTVQGTPVSLQSKGGAQGSKSIWQNKIRSAFQNVHPADHFNTDEKVSMTIYYFLHGELGVDLDNIIKPIADALVPGLLADDRQITWLEVQCFEYGMTPDFATMTEELIRCIGMTSDRIYVMLDKTMIEDL